MCETRRPARPCPPWCDVDDHKQFDSAEGHHSGAETIPLSAYPFEAAGELWHEVIIVSLEIGPGDDGPHVQIVPRSEAAGDVMRLTLDEAEQVAGALTRLLAAAKSMS